MKLAAGMGVKCTGRLPDRVGAVGTVVNQTRCFDRVWFLVEVLVACCPWVDIREYSSDVDHREGRGVWHGVEQDQHPRDTLHHEMQDG
jgi:hypothetical protein